MALLSSSSDSTVEITVPSSYIKDMIMQETPLLNLIRSECHDPELKFVPEIKPEAFPDYLDQKLASPVTPKEKYIKMLEKNPTLGQLTQKLGLKLDSEFS